MMNYECTWAKGSITLSGLHVYTDTFYYIALCLDLFSLVWSLRVTESFIISFMAWYFTNGVMAHWREICFPAHTDYGHTYILKLSVQEIQ